MPAPPKKGESKDKFISRCISYIVKNEGKPRNQAVAICNSMWRRRNMSEEENEEYEEFNLEVPLKSYTSEVTELDEGEPKKQRAVALVGDNFYHGNFLPAGELKKAHKGWEGTLHDFNHQGTTGIVGMGFVRGNILYFVGYNDNVSYDDKTRSMSMDVNYDGSTHYGNAIKAYVALCERAGQVPNVSVSFMAKRGTMKASELPEGVNYEAYGIKKEDYVTYLYDIVPQALSTVLKGACSSDKGCGIGIKNSGDTEEPDLSDEELEKIEQEKAKIIKELRQMEGEK